MTSVPVCCACLQEKTDEEKEKEAELAQSRKVSCVFVKFQTTCALSCTCSCTHMHACVHVLATDDELFYHLSLEVTMKQHCTLTEVALVCVYIQCACRNCYCTWGMYSS